MSNIGLIYLGFEEKEMRTDFLEEYSELFLLKSRVELLKELDRLEGIIIVEEEKNKLGEVCELIMIIKKKSPSFIWIISSIEKEMDKLVYLQLGADYVINKNSNKMEKELIIKNALQRSHYFIDNHEVNMFDGQLNERKSTKIYLVPENLSVMINGSVEVPLTRLEFQLLDLLFQKPGVTFTYEKLQEHIYGDTTENRQYRITNLMYHLRKKIDKADDKNSEFIKTVRSRGYMLKV